MLELLILLSIIAYPIPSYVASRRRVKNRVGIYILNIFGGFMFFGWVGSLIWAAIGEPQKEPYVESGYMKKFIFFLWGLLSLLILIFIILAVSL